MKDKGIHVLNRSFAKLLGIFADVLVRHWDGGRAVRVAKPHPLQLHKGMAPQVANHQRVFRGLYGNYLPKQIWQSWAWQVTSKSFERKKRHLCFSAPFLLNITDTFALPLTDSFQNTPAQRRHIIFLILDPNRTPHLKSTRRR